MLPLAALAAERPSTFLFRATLDTARDFAVDSASARGWSILSVTADTATFEQAIAESDNDDAAVAARTVRIVAELTEESGGIRVYLRADEVELRDTGEEWMTDVTDRYAENLTHSLTSLRMKWDTRSALRAPRLRESAPATADVQSPASPAVGTWAYYAERYAQSRGCELADIGAVLESAGPEWERHRVYCRDGRQMRVECRDGECGEAR